MLAYSSEIPGESRSNVAYAGLNPFAVPSIVVNWTAQRGWYVSDAKDDEEARNAPPLPKSGSDPIPRIGDTHPLNQGLFCLQLPVETREGGKVRIVRAIYGMLDLGGADPLKEPPDISVDWGEDCEDFDLDAELGIPITDAVGDPFDSNPTRPKFDIAVTIRRNEPFYPLQKGLKYKGTCNKGDYNIPYIGLVNDGQALCSPIRADGTWKPNPVFVPVIYTLRLRADGWRTRNLNAGFRAYYSASDGNKKNNLWDSKGEQVVKPVLLLPTGVPIDDGYTAGGETIEASPNTLPEEIFESPFADFPNLPQGFKDINFLRYNRFSKLDFTDLLSLSKKT
jgi:hypothetical protein